MARSRLVTLSISSLRNLDTEGHKFFDGARQLYDESTFSSSLY